jgi:hypothetical protein
MLPLINSAFIFRETVRFTDSVAIYDTRRIMATEDAFEKPKMGNLLPMPSITPLHRKPVREMSDFDRDYQW